jgi:hypothetical protein
MNIVKGLKVISLLIVLALAAACGGNDTCDEVQTYQLATEGQKVIVPSDMDELSPNREMTIPEPSVQGARPEGSRCLEKPPGTLVKSKT